MLPKNSVQIFSNVGKRKFILSLCHRLLSDSAQLAFCTVSPDVGVPGSMADYLKLYGTPGNLLNAQLKIAAACDRLQLVQDHVKLDLDGLLPQKLKNRAAWFLFSDYVCREVQVSRVQDIWTYSCHVKHNVAMIEATFIAIDPQGDFCLGCHGLGSICLHGLLHSRWQQHILCLGNLHIGPPCHALLGPFSPDGRASDPVRSVGFVRKFVVCMSPCRLAGTFN